MKYVSLELINEIHEYVDIKRQEYITLQSNLINHLISIDEVNKIPILLEEFSKINNNLSSLKDIILRHPKDKDELIKELEVFNRGLEDNIESLIIVNDIQEAISSLS